MARKRMMSLDIIDTDKFLDMPTSAQCLYFHLLSRADDDGFIDSPKKILKTIGCSEDDFKILFMKSYIIPFNTGVCVIKDWKIHNYIQKDRYKPTLYEDEKSQLAEDKNGAYFLGNSETKCIQNVSNLDTQVRLDKVRLEVDKNIMPCKQDCIDILNYFNSASGRGFKPIDSNLNPIKSRLNEYSGDELEIMIDFKVKEWKNDKQMSKYLRPETLFNATKCASYIEQSKLTQNASNLSHSEDLEHKEEFYRSLSR